MLAAMLGANREIFFPKLEKAQMETFANIACEMLKIHGYRVWECANDEEAIEYAAKLDGQGLQDKIYPVHFLISDTSGE